MQRIRRRRRRPGRHRLVGRLASPPPPPPPAEACGDAAAHRIIWNVDCVFNTPSMQLEVDFVRRSDRKSAVVRRHSSFVVLRSFRCHFHHCSRIARLPASEGSPRMEFSKQWARKTWSTVLGIKSAQISTTPAHWSTLIRLVSMSCPWTCRSHGGRRHRTAAPHAAVAARDEILAARNFAAAHDLAAAHDVILGHEVADAHEEAVAHAVIAEID